MVGKVLVSIKYVQSLPVAPVLVPCSFIFLIEIGDIGVRTGVVKGRREREREM